MCECLGYDDGTRHTCEACVGDLETMHERLAASESARREAEEKMEQARVQLAGCGVIALCNTEEGLAKTMPAPGSYGYSASLADVERAVRREIGLRDALASERAAREAAERERNEAKDALAGAGTLMGKTIAMSYCTSAEMPEKDHTHALPSAMLRVIRERDAAESRLSLATTALRGAEAHHDEQARLWADNEGDGEADLNAQYHSERRDVFTAVLAEVERG